MQIRAFEVGPFAVNTYLVWDEHTKRAAIVDPSMNSEGILKHIVKEGLSLEYIINTHGHVDHVFGDSFYKANAPSQAAGEASAGESGAAAKVPLLLIHEADAPMLRGLVQQALSFGVAATAAPRPDRLIADGDTISIGNVTLTVLHTPGHSPGSVCLLGDAGVLVGDTLFAGSIGRTDFPGGSHEQLIAGVRAKLFVLPDETRVYPGHGPATTIGFEKQHNPFFAGRPSSGLWLP